MRTGLLITLAVFASLGGFFLQRQLNPPATADTAIEAESIRMEFPNEITGQYRPDFSLPDLTGELRNVSEWDGQVVTVNFWATWCPPCLHEIPELVELQSRYRDQGLQIIGIALQKPEELPEFVVEQGINYPILAGEAAVIEVAESYGNTIGALPYTAIIDRNGRIVFVKPGPVTGAEVEAVIGKLL